MGEWFTLGIEYSIIIYFLFFVKGSFWGLKSTFFVMFMGLFCGLKSTFFCLSHISDKVLFCYGLHVLSSFVNLDYMYMVPVGVKI